MPGAQLLSWGPYGQIDNCVRQQDDARTWIGFLNRDRRAHDQWCAAMIRKNAKSLAPQSFVDEVGRGMNAPCR